MCWGNPDAPLAPVQAQGAGDSPSGPVPGAEVQRRREGTQGLGASLEKGQGHRLRCPLPKGVLSLYSLKGDADSGKQARQPPTKGDPENNLAAGSLLREPALPLTAPARSRSHS